MESCLVGTGLMIVIFRMNDYPSAVGCSGVLLGGSVRSSFRGQPALQLLGVEVED
jgi:hypothetical protein